MSPNLESFLNREVDRGQFLREIGSAAAAFLIPPLYYPQESSGMVYAQKRAWTSRNWWPIFESTALARGIPRLADPNWIGDLHDQLNRQVFATDSHVYGYLAGEAYRVWRDYGNDPVQIESAGYCHAYAIASVLESEPPASREYAGQVFDRVYLEGFLAIKHAGDVMIPIPTSGEVLRAVVGQGGPLVVDLPESLGHWYRGVVGISENGQMVRVTAYGFPDKDLPTSMVVAAYIPVHNPTEPVSPQLQVPVDGRKIPGVNEVLVNQLVYGN